MNQVINGNAATQGAGKSGSFAALPPPQSGIGRAVQDDNNDLRQQYYGAVGAMRALGAMGALGAVGAMRAMRALGAVGAMGAERLKARALSNSLKCASLWCILGSG